MHGILPMLKQLPTDIKLINWPTQLYNESGYLCKNKISELKNHRLVVINCSSEHWGELACIQLDDLLKDTGLNFLLLSHDTKDHLATPRIIFYPNWYYWAIDNFIFPAQQNLNNPRRYKLSCLNGNPRPHRILNYFLLKQKPYVNESLITFHQSCELMPRRDDIELDSETLSWWQQAKHTLNDKTDKNLADSVSDTHINHPAHTDSYIHLVTETTVDRKLFVTEKTWKPVAMGQLFLVLGAPGIITYLRNQSVDVFDDVIDHNYYDSEPDTVQRINKLQQVLDDLIAQDLPGLYQLTQQRREDNARKFLAGQFDQQIYIDSFKSKTQ